MNAAVLATNYEDLEPLIASIVQKMYTKYGGHYDDMMCRGNELFMRAVNSHDPDKMSLSSWVHTHVWGGLMDDIRSAAQRNTRFPRAEFNELECRQPDTIDEFNYSQFTAAMTKDAKTVVLLTLTNGHVDSPRQYLRGLLRGMGWSVSQITDAFNEITEFIS